MNFGKYQFRGKNWKNTTFFKIEKNKMTLIIVIFPPNLSLGRSLSFDGNLYFYLENLEVVPFVIKSIIPN